MKNLLIAALFFVAANAQAGQSTCVAAVADTLIDVQAKELNLNDSDKAKYFVEVWGDIINNEGIAKDLEILCTKAYIKAVPLPEQK